MELVLMLNNNTVLGDSLTNHVQQRLQQMGYTWDDGHGYTAPRLAGANRIHVWNPHAPSGLAINAYGGILTSNRHTMAIYPASEWRAFLEHARAQATITLNFRGAPVTISPDKVQVDLQDFVALASNYGQILREQYFSR